MFGIVHFKRTSPSSNSIHIGKANLNMYYFDKLRLLHKNWNPWDDHIGRT